MELTMLSHPSNFSKGRTKPIKYLVFHYTANKGDTARANAKYFQGPNRHASAHCFVDENDIVKTVNDKDTAWCVGVDYSRKTAKYWGICNNSNSINIEICSDYADGEYILTEKSILNALKAGKKYMAAYGITIDRVLRHYDVCGKTCPAPWVKHPEQWTEFLKRLEAFKL